MTLQHVTIYKARKFLPDFTVAYFSAAEMSLNNSPYVFNTQADRNLRVIFNAAVAQMVWNEEYEGPNCPDFHEKLDARFENHIDFLQDKTIEVVQEMFRSRFMLTPHITIEDIFRFFHQEDPLFQLYTHAPSRRGFKYGIRCCYIRWIGRQEEAGL